MPSQAKPSPFRSALAAGAVTPAQILAFHNATFGNLRMEDAGGDDGGDGGGDGGDNATGSGDEKGFPAETPIADMTAEQQAAYWKHQARKHESTSKARGDYDAVVAERDRLKTATQTDAEKAVEAAKTEASTSATVEARNQYVPQLVTAKLEAALAGKMPAEKIAAQVEFLDHTKFLTEAGEVDTDKVKQYAAGLAPAGGQWPDTGQGNRGTKTSGKGVGVGADMFAASRGKSST